MRRYWPILRRKRCALKVQIHVVKNYFRGLNCCQVWPFVLTILIFAVVILMIILAFLQVEFFCFLRVVVQTRNFLWTAVVTVVNETIS